MSDPRHRFHFDSSALFRPRPTSSANTASPLHTVTKFLHISLLKKKLHMNKPPLNSYLPQPSQKKY